MDKSLRPALAAALVAGAFVSTTALANPCPLVANVRMPIKTHVVSGSDSIGDGCTVDTGGTLEETGTLVVAAGAVLGSTAGGTLLIDAGATLQNGGITSVGGSTTNIGLITNTGSFLGIFGSFGNAGTIDSFAHLRLHRHGVHEHRHDHQ